MFTNLVAWLIPVSLLMFFGSIFLGWFLIIKMPADYLTADRQNGFRDRHPLSAGLLFVTTNLIGLALLVAGLVMLVTPGQGMMFIFLGVAIMDFPGKRKLLRRVLGNPKVLTMVIGIRAQSHAPPLKYPQENPDLN